MLVDLIAGEPPKCSIIFSLTFFCISVRHSIIVKFIVLIIFTSTKVVTVNVNVLFYAKNLSFDFDIQILKSSRNLKTFVCLFLIFLRKHHEFKKISKYDSYKIRYNELSPTNFCWKTRWLSFMFFIEIEMMKDFCQKL